MKDTFQEYNELWSAEPTKIIRKVLKKIEDDGGHEFEDSDAHNAMKGYFNRERLHKKMTKPEFEAFKSKK